MPFPKLCPWCRTGLHHDCSNVNCDCTHDDHGDDEMTVVPCPHCDRSCAGPAGLASHIRSMHPEVLREDPTREPPPDTNSGGLVWEDPPARGRDASLIPELVALIPRLKERPGSWARLRTYKSATGAGGAKAKAKDAPELAHLEFRASRVDGGSALYGRYVEAE